MSEASEASEAFQKMRAITRRQILDAFPDIPEDAFIIAQDGTEIGTETQDPTGVEPELAPKLKLNTGMDREVPAG